MSKMRNSVHFFLSVLGLPEDAPPQLRGGCGLMVAATVPLWGLGVAGCWRHWQWGTMGMVHDAATATLILAGVFWASAIIAASIDDRLVTLVCELVRRLARDTRRHLQPAAAAHHPVR